VGLEAGKKSLEVLLTTGQLMVRDRDQFQRVYDLTSRVLPEWSDENNPYSPKDSEAYLLSKSVAALGIVVQTGCLTISECALNI
jgi:uncharacterized protein YcaQ